MTLLWALSCGEPFERGPKQINYVPPDPTDDDDDVTANDDDDDVTSDDDDITNDDDDITSDDDDDDDTVAAPSWLDDVHPVLVARCQVCHQNGGPAGSSALVMTGDPSADYVEIGPFLDEDSPADSPLLTKGTGQQTHAGQAALPPDHADYATLLSWIEAGAPSE
jgi:hypothetical protein